MKEDQLLNDLFESARREIPKTSFGHTEASFISALASPSGSSGLLSKINGLTFKTKFIMAISTIVLSTGLFFGLHFGFMTESVESNEIIESKNELVNDEGINNFRIEIVEISDLEEQIPRQEELVQSDTENAVDILDFLSKPVEIYESQLLEPELIEGTDKVVHQQDQGDTVIRECFVISNESTKEDFEKIHLAAQKAGVGFSYTVKRNRKGKIRRCEISMHLKRMEGSKCKKTCTITGRFNYTFGWFLDETGKASELMD